MNKLKAMSIFVKIVDCGSFSGAAEKLNMSQSSVARSLAALESELGTQLLYRTTRRVTLTEEGFGYCQRCRQILLEVEDAESVLTQNQSSPQGVIRITAPQTFGRFHLNPLIEAFLASHPGMEVELLLLDRVVDLLEEGMDIALRIGHLPDSSLIAKRVGEVSFKVCASPDFIAETGEPKAPHELENYNCIHLTALKSHAQWLFNTQGDDKRVTASGRFKTNHVETALDACKSGLGLGQFLSYQIAPSVASGQLVTVLDDFDIEPLPVNLVYPQSRLLSSRSKTFINWAAPRLRKQLTDIQDQLSGQ